MKALRSVAVLLALSLMIGELWRSWGTDRPIAFVLDDMIMGALLIYGAWRMRRDTPRDRVVFGAAWGVAAGMLYGSFFGKLFDPASVDPGNWDLGVLTMLVGTAFAVSLGGLVATVLLPDRE